MKEEVKIEIPDSAELLHGTGFKAWFRRLRTKAKENVKYIVTIVVAIPFLVAVCRYAYFCWQIAFNGL